MNPNNQNDAVVERLEKSNLRLKIVCGILTFLIVVFLVYALVQKAFADEGLKLAEVNAQKAMEMLKKSKQCEQEANRQRETAERIANEMKELELKTKKK